MTAPGNVCPRLVIAGVGSGVGKTSLTLGLVRLLTRRGLRVQTFKVGPDFLDPTYLALASGRTCYNLDGWMTSRAYVGELFHRATADADLAIVEGVMGLFDGASPTTLEGSTAEIAVWLNAPVALVVNAHGAARSLAATVLGFARFESELSVAGVIANQGGSARHRQWVSESLAAAGAPPLWGMVPRDGLPTLKSRHLGLVTANESGLSLDLLNQLADACEQHLDVERLVEAASTAAPKALSTSVPQNLSRDRFLPPDQLKGSLGDSPSSSNTRRIRLGLARDAAFQFYYADNLEALVRQGVELVPFSPLDDVRLPERLNAVYLGGGYPELHAARLAANSTLLAELRQFAANGGCIYGECGGLMYLGESLTTLDGQTHPLCGILPIRTAMLPKLKSLGYSEVAWQRDCLWGQCGGRLRGHEFHYSQITTPDEYTGPWQPAYSVTRRRAAATRDGFALGRILAGYVHLHWASQPEAVAHFLDYCEQRP